MSLYVVFKGDGKSMQEFKRVEAVNPKAAITAVADEEAHYAATPARSWVTLPVKFERKAKLG